MKNVCIQITCECETCEGTGRDWYRSCWDCQGTGRQTINVTLKELQEMLYEVTPELDQGKR